MLFKGSGVRLSMIKIFQKCALEVGNIMDRFYFVIMMSVRLGLGGGGEGGGGCTLIFSFIRQYVGSGPACTVYPNKYQEFQAPQKIFEILAIPKISTKFP